MPCTYTGTIHGDRDLQMRTALDKRERMLCALCRQLELEIGVNDTKHMLLNAAIMADGLDPTEISTWWKKHKEVDNERS